MSIHLDTSYLWREFLHMKFKQKIVNRAWEAIYTIEISRTSLVSKDRPAST